MHKKIILILTVSIFVLSATLSGKAPQENNNNNTTEKTWDNDTYIDANMIFMFVTNHGNMGRDLSGMFGYDYGTWYPYSGNIIDIEQNINGAADKSPLYAAGIWLGGKVNNQVRVAISEYESEYVPGPMLNGSFQNDRPEFRTYKLYSDSMANNPNSDYLNWPVNQGAPTDINGKPKIIGDQMLWSVYNDADASNHYNMLSDPLGVEIQQTVYAFSRPEVDTSWQLTPFLDVNPPEYTNVTVTAVLVDENTYTGKDYSVIIEEIEGLGTVWKVLNVTDNIVMIDEQTNFSGDDNYPVIDGYKIKVNYGNNTFTSFQVVANANGPIDPPESGAASWRDFPVPTDVRQNGMPSDGQQVGPAMWLFHTGDNGGTSGGGTRYSFESFISRTFRDGNPDYLERLGKYDWEMRFTGSYDNPGVGGSYAWDGFLSKESYWVPFELWRIGIDTPDDPSDDLRLIPWIYGGRNDLTYDLSSYGSALDDNCGPQGCEHSASNGNDDPFTDWLYWAIPADDQGNLIETPGEIAYLIFEQAMKNDPNSWPGYEKRVMDRTVLINWNGGIQPPFNQDLPEKGTIFRLVTEKGIIPGEFTFSQTQTPVIYSDNSDNESIYIKYKLYNKGSNIINDMYFNFWGEPDLGTAEDDLVGCDTLNDIFYCYNSANHDNQYGPIPPAIGFKIIYGPLVPSPGETAVFDGVILNNYKNLSMTSFQKYRNGIDPDNSQQTYNYMRGLTRDGNDYIYNGQVLKYVNSGNPVNGFGDLDTEPNDKRMMASCGPFDFNPGDSQFVLIKMVVSQGTSNLNSITEVIESLNASCVDTDGDGLGNPGFPDNTCEEDKCPTIYDPTNADSNGDGIGDACTFVEITDPGTNVINSIGTNVKLTFDNVSNGGETNMTITTTGPELPEWYTIIPLNVPTYYNITTTAQHTGNIEVCISYDDLDLTWEDEEALNILHFDGVEWVDITSSKDPFITNTICGLTTSLSPFVVAIKTGNEIICGDINFDTFVDINDIGFFTSLYWECGPLPENLQTSDLNCNSLIDLADIVILIEYIYGNTTNPCCD